MTYTLDAYGNLINESDEPHVLFDTTQTVPIIADTPDIFTSMPLRPASHSIFRSTRIQRTQNQANHYPSLENWLNEGHARLNEWRQAGDARIDDWENAGNRRINKWKALARPDFQFPIFPSPSTVSTPPRMPHAPVRPLGCSEVEWNTEKQRIITAWGRKKDTILALWSRRKNEIKNLWEHEKMKAIALRSRI